jgi:hypothetical protein
MSEKKKSYCFYCKKEVKRNGGYAKNSLHMDHVYPKSMFPELEYYSLNLVVSCANCNRRKGNMIPGRWFEKMQTMNDYDERDLDRVGLRMSMIIFEGIRSGRIGFYDWPMMSFQYSEWKMKDFVRKETAKFMQSQEDNNGTR